MRFKHPLFTAIATIGLLVLSGTGCSDKDSGSAALAGLCGQLDAKQNELDCKVAALGETCATGNTTCMATKQADLAKCDSLSSANFTSTRTSLCTAAPATGSASSTGTTTATATSLTLTSSTSTALFR
jgi:hypothetical protein